VKSIIARSALKVARLQVCLIYFHAAIAKLSQTEWGNGTAMYYWLTNPVFGFSEPIRGISLPLLRSPVGVTALTWGVITLEVLLAAAIVMEKSKYPRLLGPAILFHAAIVLGHGLFSFFFAMAGALIVYLRPADCPFSGAGFRAMVGRLSGPLRRDADREGGQRLAGHTATD
jgi:antimicrobial peptide system SdpB family protein